MSASQLLPYPLAIHINVLSLVILGVDREKVTSCMIAIFVVIW